MNKILLVAGLILLAFGILSCQSSGSNTGGQYAGTESFITSTIYMLLIGTLSSFAIVIGIINSRMVLRLRKRAKTAKEFDQDIPKAFLPGNYDVPQQKRWDAEHEKLGIQVQDLKERLFDFENRLKAFEDDGRVVEFTVEKTDRISVAPPSPAQQILYAKFPDTYNGFSTAILFSEQDGEKIYEITSDGETATFQISEDKDAQKYALSDYNYYLANACIMENAPEKDCRIVTETPGKLTRNGKDWIIAEKALIKFI